MRLPYTTQLSYSRLCPCILVRGGLALLKLDLDYSTNLAIDIGTTDVCFKGRRVNVEKKKF